MMVKPRLVSDERTEDELTLEAYDHMQRRFRDKGWLGTEQVVKAGIDNGLALEVGPGPGYLGLEWLRKTEGTTLKGLDISPSMVDIAMRNAEEYGLQERASFELGDALHMPFEDAAFDALFCSLSLHEWSDAKGILNHGGH
jgi:ubiquinone/menaquinone biosynthesis C-methylase UbiE